jgi:group I intron endonuclease
MSNKNLLDLISNKSQMITRNGIVVNVINLNIQSVNECRNIFRKISCVYAWQNKFDNKIYIGSAINLWRRFLSYKNSFLSKEKKNNIKLIRANKKYGFGSIQLFILEIINKDKSELKLREQFFLDMLRPFDKNGYNISKSSDRPLHCKLSKLGRKKIKLRHTGENSEMSKLKDEEIILIKEMLFKNISLREISLKFKVSKTVISNICRNKTWTHIKASNEVEKFLEQKTKNQKQKYKHLIPEIVNLLKNGSKMIDLSKKYNIKYTTINNIKIRYLNRISN